MTLMISCPESNCHSTEFSKDGFYFRSNDSRKIQRFVCKTCGKKFSSSTHTLEYHHKKRRHNHLIFKLFASGMSQRRLSLIFNLHRTTIKRKFIYCGKKAKLIQSKLLQDIPKNSLTQLQVDDLITIEHTKLKPLTVSVAVAGPNRFIMGAHVARIPAFGHLAKLSRSKYGHRKSAHKDALKNLFEELVPLVHPQATFKSDEHKFYPEFIRRYFPKSVHKTYKSERASVIGQGELKLRGYDPIYMVNHTLGMFRANINRLFRRSWCTTKLPEMLQIHLNIYIAYHNSNLISKN